MALPATFTIDAPPLRGPAVFGQRWQDLTFLHWSIDPDAVADLFPPGVRPDVFDGKTYVGLVPFHMRKAGLGRGHPTPWLGDFPETNVRLYSVDDEGRHGVVFRSLEASRLVTALAARFGYNIPYTWAKMRIARRGARLRYLSTRRWPDAGLRCAVTVEIGPELTAPTELDVFLTARWGLHSTLLGRTVWHPNFHRTWPLREARLISLDSDLVSGAGIRTESDWPDIPTRYSPGVLTHFGPPERLR